MSLFNLRLLQNTQRISGWWWPDGLESRMTKDFTNGTYYWFVICSILAVRVDRMPSAKTRATLFYALLSIQTWSRQRSCNQIVSYLEDIIPGIHSHYERDLVYKNTKIQCLIQCLSYNIFFLVAKLLYKSKCLSRLGGNVIFSAPNWDIAPILFVQIPFINEHLFCKYFVRLSVGNALLLMDVVILVFYLNDLISEH